MPSGSSIKTRFLRSGGILIAALLWTQSADAHGIAGNRYFAGTITFDDPAVADELILPNFSYLESPAQGSNVAENRINGAFARLLTRLWRSRSTAQAQSLCPSPGFARVAKCSLRQTERSPDYRSQVRNKVLNCLPSLRRR